MYSISKDKIKGKVDNELLVDGFLMTSNKKSFKIGTSKIKGVTISNKKLAYPIVSDKVMRKYNKLISYLTELMVDDDPTGDAMREVLNRIEKFRLEIKIKYRKYLKKKDLEMMSKKLLKLQKLAQQRLLEIQNEYFESLMRNRSR